MPRWRTLLLAVLVLAAAVVPYGRTLDYKFVWDDAFVIGPHLDVRGPSDLARLWKTPFDDFLKDEPMTRTYFRPAVLYTFALDRAVSGEDPRGFHLTNIALYAGACLFLWLFAWEFSGRPVASAFGTVLFALHPIHAESVAFVSGRTDVQAALFLFASLWAALRFGPAIRNPWMKLVPAAALLLPGLYAKEVALFGAPALVLAFWVKERRIPGRDLARASGAVVAVSALYLATRLMVLGFHPIPAIAPVEGTTAQILTSVAVVARYLPLLLTPFHLSARHEIVEVRAPDLIFAAGLLALAAIAAGLWVTIRRRSVWSVPLVLFAATLLPVCYVRLLSGAIVAERFLFVPSAALALAIALAPGALRQAASPAGKAKPKKGRETGAGVGAGDAGGGLLLAVAALSLWFAVLLWPRVAIWRDEGTLFGSMLRDSPESPNVHAIVGRLRYAERDLDRAIVHYRRAIQLAPERSAELLLNLGAAEDETGQYDSAFVHIRRLNALRPNYAAAWYTLGNLYVRVDKPDSAILAYREAIRIVPNFAQAENNMGAVHERQGHFEEALAAYRRALVAFPGYPDATNNLRRLSAELGRPSGLDSLAGGPTGGAPSAATGAAR